MKRRLQLFFIYLFLGGVISMAQEEQPTDDLGEVSDAFQEHFFEALKQKAIENYELALTSLQKARDAASEEQKPVVYFEMGKNLASLKRYGQAEERYKQVLELKGEQLDVLESLYDLYYDQKDYQSALPLVERLSKIDPDYKEDLANLYAITGEFQKALALLDELDEAWGESLERNRLRRRIYAQTGDSEGAIGNLEKRINDNPKNEQDYLNLIFLYSQQGDKEKAYQTARELLAQQPGSQKVHLALYKFYLDDNKPQEAIRSMKIVLDAPGIEQEQKFRVLDDFISTATEQAGYENALEEVLQGFDDGQGGLVNEKLGQYFLAKGDKEKALEYFTKGLEQAPSNFNLIRNCLLLQIDFKQFEKASALSEEAKAVFPAQPLLYLAAGVSANALGQSEKAIQNLQEGLDYLFDNPQMEKDFYLQLSVAYKASGNASRAEEFGKRAEEIQISN